MPTKDDTQTTASTEGIENPFNPSEPTPLWLTTSDPQFPQYFQVHIFDKDGKLLKLFQRLPQILKPQQ